MDSRGRIFGYTGHLAFAALVVAACGGAGGADDGGTSGGEETAVESAAAGGGPAADTSSGTPEVDWSLADTVDVRLTEYRIQMPRTLPPGPTVFRVHNAGAREHNFSIEGKGVSESFGLNLPQGRTRGLRVVLYPGRYKVYCPVQDHVFEGMLVGLEVTRDTAAESDTADTR